MCEDRAMVAFFDSKNSGGKDREHTERRGTLIFNTPSLGISLSVIRGTHRVGAANSGTVITE